MDGSNGPPGLRGGVQPQRPLNSSRQSFNKKPAIMVVIVLIFVALSLHKMELSQYLEPDASFAERSNTTIITANRKNVNYGHGEDNDLPSSPACRPHFRLALPHGNWTESIKFKRLYFYHARKAGGTTLRRYFQKVAAHHGLKYAVTEYELAEDPGSHDEATFYVTHLREPVARSISHFKYEGRWECNHLVNNDSFVPSEENANKLETWNKNHGHHLSTCKYDKKAGGFQVRVSLCAINCYIQWFAGLSCPWWDPPKVPGPGPEGRPIRRELPIMQQYDVAKKKIMRYNFIVITELLRDPEYVAAIERFFGVPDITISKVHPFCEVESHHANEKIPLVIKNETLNNLTRLNAVDSQLYHDMRDCIDEKNYTFPAWDSSRFETRAELPSPACRPHLQVALPGGKWTNDTKFKRLYFYSVRRAGGTSLRRYFEKVAAHHGLQYVAVDSYLAEDPGSHSEPTFYVTHIREPVSRSISQFKYEGRWDCKQMLTNASFVPTVKNALPLETWNQSFGHEPSFCMKENGEYLFKMEKCAVNCYSQWFSGLSCPWWDPPQNPGPGASPTRRERGATQLFDVARAKLLRYNFIVVTEMLQDPAYAAGLELFFGVPGVAERKYPQCEFESKYANDKIPLVEGPETRKKLMHQNVRDIGLYYEIISPCQKEHHFPVWDSNRFETNTTIQVNYNITEERWSKTTEPTAPNQTWLDKFNKIHGKPS